jgi:glyoxylase-like metal-dependent hydrolase (beta-lactamase superfamily II)
MMTQAAHFMTVDANSLRIRQVVNSIFNSCTYVLSQGGETWLVDCGDLDGILPQIDGNLRGVLLTHAHFDHIYGLNHLLTLFPDLTIVTNESGGEGLLSDKLNFSRYHEEPFILDVPENIRIVRDGETIPMFDGVSARAVFTPGHSPSCVTWLVADAIFTGDSYIPGVKTVTAFPHSNKVQAAQSELLIKRIAKNRRIYPGHATLY